MLSSHFLCTDKLLLICSPKLPSNLFSKKALPIVNAHGAAFPDLIQSLITIDASCYADRRIHSSYKLFIQPGCISLYICIPEDQFHRHLSQDILWPEGSSLRRFLQNGWAIMDFSYKWHIFDSIFPAKFIHSI